MNAASLCRSPLPNPAQAALPRTFLLSGLLLFSLSLVGCSEEPHQDLQSYVEQVKARQTGRVPPLPEVRRYETVAYQAQDLRDPFIATFKLEQEREVQSNNGIRPNLDRKREALEAFSLDSLALVGQLEKAGEHWALIAAPDGTVHRVQEGNHVGQNYGEIVAITENRVEVKEIVPDGLGGWMERPASMALTE